MKNSQKNRRYKAFSATKILFLMLVSTGFMLFLIGSVSALEFDNKLTYEKKDIKVSFDNLFGLGKHFGEIELKSHSSVTEIKQFGFGKEEVVIYYDFTNWELYENGLGEVIFTDMRTGKEINKDYYFVEWKEIDVPNYVHGCKIKVLENKTEIEVCETILEGTKREFQWVKYNSLDIPVGNLRIGLKTYIGKDDYIDAVWTIVGKKVSKHASWTAELEVGLTNYYSFEGNTDDNVSVSDLNITGAVNLVSSANCKIGLCYNWTGVADAYMDGAGFSNVSTGDISFNFWSNWHLSPYSTGSSVFDTRSGGGNNNILVQGYAGDHFVNYTWFTGGATGEVGTWAMYTLIRDSNVWLIYKDGVSVGTNSTDARNLYSGEIIFGAFADGSTEAQTFNGYLDEIGRWNRSLSIAEITQLYNEGAGMTYGIPPPTSPTINIDKPNNNTNFTTGNIVFNATIFDDGTITNATLYINNTGNETNLTAGVNNSLYTFTKDMAEGRYSWLIESCDNENNCINSSARIFDILFTFPTIVVDKPNNNTNFTIGNIVFNATIFDDGSITNATLFINNTANETNSTAGVNNSLYTFTKDMAEGRYFWLFQACDNNSQCINSSARIFDILFTFPTITIDKPENNTNFTLTNNVIMNATIFDDGSITNATLYINNTGNETNSTSGVNNSVYTFDKNMGEGLFYWLIESCDDTSKCINSSAREFRINTTPTIAFGDGVPVNNYNSSIDNFEVNVTLTETLFKNITFDLYSGGVINSTVTFTNSSREKDWTNLIDGDYSYNVTMATTTNVFGNTNTRNITIDSSVPDVDVFSPIANIVFHENKTNLYLNWSANDTHLSHCIYNYNSTNMSLTCSDNQTTINITDYTDTNLTFWVNDTFGLVNTTFISWEYRLFQISQTYTASIKEGVASSFTINLLTNGSDITLGNLSYDNQQYIGTITEGTNDNFTITKSVVAPSVSTSTAKTFFWNITQNTFNYALASQTQTVNDTNIDNCSVNTQPIYNFTIVDEETQVKINGNVKNTTGRINLQLFSLGRAISLTNYSTLFNGTNPFYVCINDTFAVGELYNVDVQVEYDSNGTVKELYHIQNNTLNSTTMDTNITLYSLADASSQVFRLIVKDSSYLALTNALIEVQRKYIDENVFKVVEIPKTDEQGETTAHLVVNDAIYNFVIKRYGTTIKSINNVIPVCQTPVVSTCKIDFNAFETSIQVPDYEVGIDFNYTLAYNSSSKVVSSVFDIPSGAPAIIVLSVIVDDELGTSVCTDTLTSNTGTLSCIVPSNFGNATVLAKLTKDNLEVARGNIKLDQDPSDIYGTSLLFLGLFAMLTLVGASVSDNPVYTLVFFMLGVILLFSLNLVANNGLIGGSATILWLIMAIIIVIIKGARRN